MSHIKKKPLLYSKCVRKFVKRGKAPGYAAARDVLHSSRYLLTRGNLAHRPADGRGPGKSAFSGESRKGSGTMALECG